MQVVFTVAAVTKLTRNVFLAGAFLKKLFVPCNCAFEGDCAFEGSAVRVGAAQPQHRQSFTRYFAAASGTSLRSRKRQGQRAGGDLQTHAHSSPNTGVIPFLALRTAGASFWPKGGASLSLLRKALPSFVLCFLGMAALRSFNNALAFGHLSVALCVTRATAS